MSKLRAFSTTTSAFRPLDTTTALRPTRMDCPNCARNGAAKVPLSAETALKVDFHHCSECGGVWFYEKDADLALRAAGSRTWPLPRAAQAPPTEFNPGWTCPCCAGTLVQIQDRRRTGASMRRCLVCYGGWIDHSDLLRLTEASAHLFSRFGRIIRGEF